MSPVPVLATVLVCVLAGGCSATPDPSSTSAPTSAATPAHTPAPTPAPSTSRPSRARSPRPPRPAPPPRETVGNATTRQLVGLVRIVASIGSDGRGETSTGMVMSSDGEVVTNNHGVAGATAVQATVMSTGRTYPARVVATDADHDVALLRLEGASGLAGEVLAQRAAAVGDPVTVVGDGHGLRSTFTAATGTVLARNQTLVTPATATTPGERLTGVLLTSCNVVLGESGGPTYDANGRVAAMTTAAVRSSRGPDGVSIPVSTLRQVVRDLERR